MRNSQNLYSVTIRTRIKLNGVNKGIVLFHADSVPYQQAQTVYDKTRLDNPKLRIKMVLTKIISNI